jgi:hypothetical protein
LQFETGISVAFAKKYSKWWHHALLLPPQGTFRFFVINFSPSQPLNFLTSFPSPIIYTLPSLLLFQAGAPIY